MDARAFREFLEVAKDFKLETFSLNGLHVVFSQSSHYNKEDPSMAPSRGEMDPDEMVLAHIEKLKAQASVGLKEV